MTADLASRYDQRVPRYTSYPTAPHFTDGIGPDDYAAWLGGLDATRALSLYFHIPFCDSMCWFCGCYTKIVKQYKPIASYLEVLIKEIEEVADRLPARFPARHLHWGGGSPTLLTGADWMRTLERIRARFDVAADAEVAVEMDPRDTTEDYVRDLAAAGVNRASIGVQDFDPEVQKAINRDQPYDVTRRVVEWLRRHGIGSLNMDLMYGLPHQTVARVEAMVEKALTLEPQRVALFGYAHVPWMKAHQKLIDEAALPDTVERWRQFTAASARLIAAGYVAVGLDHFARPDDALAVALGKGRLHRNFQGYTVDDAAVLLGFGASAIGSLPQGYVQNVSPLKDYARAIEGGTLATGRGVALSADDRLRAEIIERLMCDLAVDLDDVARKHGASAGGFGTELAGLTPLRADGIVVLDGRRIALTEAGRPFVRLVAAAFDTYLQTGQARHSKAV
ncbi:oxygen-independent coproporphyrinogen III oxidase [Shumkonia mesophila]|uniref:oxygen-independent coproporphyrinogen III oxidase n=1 Tax=Shumkonia mesophila TaxID=2838854 RepID=UPI00293498F1|nr:oxygen-independent coproporphyrinogen III oxidase [Shumkonia mesophila]